jgi:hypothetical protein
MQNSECRILKINQITINYVHVTYYMAYHLAGIDLWILSDHMECIEKV